MIDTYAANRRDEQRIRAQLGSGTVRVTAWQRLWRWYRRNRFACDVVASALAGIALGLFLAWLLVP